MVSRAYGTLNEDEQLVTASLKIAEEALKVTGGFKEILSENNKVVKMDVEGTPLSIIIIADPRDDSELLRGIAQRLAAVARNYIRPDLYSGLPDYMANLMSEKIDELARPAYVLATIPVLVKRPKGVRDPVARRLLELCDGKMSISEMAREMGTSVLHILRILADFHSKGVIAYRFGFKRLEGEEIEEVSLEEIPLSRKVSFPEGGEEV